MAVPKVAITGGAGVGKTALFRWILGRKVMASKDDVQDPALLRPRALAEVGAGDDTRYFDLVDAGALVGSARDDRLPGEATAADLLLFVVDIGREPAPAETEAACQLGYMKTPVILVMNKADTPASEGRAENFARFGRGRRIAVSAAADRNREGLMGLIAELLPRPVPKPAGAPVKLALVGRPGAGKSTLVQFLGQSEWAVEPNGPGRDLKLQIDGRELILLAGSAREGGAESVVPVDLGLMQDAERAIDRADVVLLMLDITRGISRIDRQLADRIASRYKPCIFAINKLDRLAPGTSGPVAGVLVKHASAVQHAFRAMSYMPLAFLSAQSGASVREMLEAAAALDGQAQSKINPRTLNWVLRQAVERYPLPPNGEHVPQIQHATQVAVAPPTIVFHVNSTSLFDLAYQRYLLNVIRQQLPFHDVPIKLHLRSRRAAPPPAANPTAEAGNGVNGEAHDPQGLLCRTAD
jgi:GTP-binding protein